MQLFTESFFKLLELFGMIINDTYDAGGLRGALNEIKPKIPMQDIGKMIEIKMKNTLPFRNLINMLKNGHFRANIKKVISSSSVQDLIFYSKLNGVNVDMINEFFRNLLFENINTSYFLGY